MPAVWLFCLAACNGPAKEEQQAAAPPIVADTPAAPAQGLAMMEAIEKSEAQYKKELHVVKDPLHHDIELHLQQDNGIARRLSYSLHEEGDDTVTINYYFDTHGRLFGEKVWYPDMHHIVLFEGSSGRILNMSLHDGRLDTIAAGDDVAILSKRAVAAWDVSRYMQFFPKAGYTNIPMSARTMPTLRTFSQVPLKAAPGEAEKIIRQLPDNSHLVYLSSTQQPDTIGNEAWIWYEVQLEDGTSGWVWGLPERVGQLNDDNWQ